ncbi:band 7 protein [Parafrankia sp. EAN1pec]|uniref:flotillin family protein n=1 Tax=Parafrankia sp. (strain EAN1pec) TaxID=298653 RepID=UPI0000540B6F|nr:band 7 protein [Frankia sp. EAN1pec]
MMIILISVAVGAVLAVALFKLMWRVAEPNEALIISGMRAYKDPNDAVAESLGFKIVTGKGVLVPPGVQTVRRMSLDLRAAQLGIECVTQQGIPVGVRGVVIFKVGDDYASIANAARRFLDQQDKMDTRVHNVFAGHLRAIVGQLTVEDLIRDREKLTQLTRASSGTEMEKLGLIVDSLQVQEIDDPTGYIRNLGRPHVATVAAQARIAEAEADREATEQEQIAMALKAEANRNSSIKQSGFQAEVDEASARATQAGPLAEATAHQQVVVEQTKVAQLEAELEEQRLQVSVRKPADARAYEQTTLARATRDAQISSAEAAARQIELAAAADATRVRTEADARAQQVRVLATAEAASTRAIGDADAHAKRAVGSAEGDAMRARGLAEAEAIKARADALAVNQDAVIGQQLAEQWPAIVEAAAKPFGAVDQLIVLNGAAGLGEVLTQALSQGAAGLQLARSLLSSGTPGSTPAAPTAPTAPGAPAPGAPANGTAKPADR